MTDHACTMDDMIQAPGGVWWRCRVCGDAVGLVGTPAPAPARHLVHAPGMLEDPSRGGLGAARWELADLRWRMERLQERRQRLRRALLRRARLGYPAEFGWPRGRNWLTVCWHMNAEHRRMLREERRLQLVIARELQALDLSAWWAAWDSHAVAP